MQRRLVPSLENKELVGDGKNDKSDVDYNCSTAAGKKQNIKTDTLYFDVFV